MGFTYKGQVYQRGKAAAGGPVGRKHAAAITLAGVSGMEVGQGVWHGSTFTPASAFVQASRQCVRFAERRLDFLDRAVPVLSPLQADLVRLECIGRAPQDYPHLVGTPARPLGGFNLYGWIARQCKTDGLTAYTVEAELRDAEAIIQRLLLREA